MTDAVDKPKYCDFAFGAIVYEMLTGSLPDASYRAWMASRLPQATVTAWPSSGHFPHLARPEAFARVLADTAGPVSRSASRTSPPAGR